VTLYLYIYTAGLLVSAFLWVSNPGMHAGKLSSHSAVAALERQDSQVISRSVRS